MFYKPLLVTYICEESHIETLIEAKLHYYHLVLKMNRYIFLKQDVVVLIQFNDVLSLTCLMIKVYIICRIVTIAVFFQQK